MTKTDWPQLAITSVTDPASAARRLMALQLPRSALWSGLLLVASLNALLFALSNILVPPPPLFEAVAKAPALYFLFVVAGLVLTVYSIFWTGRAMGGRATLEDVMAVIVWLQGLRVLVQAATLVLAALKLAVLSALLVLAATVVGVYILLHFIDQAHRLGSLARAAGVLIASVLALALGLSLLLSLIVGPIVGSSAYV